MTAYQVPLALLSHAVPNMVFFSSQKDMTVQVNIHRHNRDSTTGHDAHLGALKANKKYVQHVPLRMNGKEKVFYLPTSNLVNRLHNIMSPEYSVSSQK